MKKRVSVTKVDGEGLDALLGKQVILLCANYFYAGKLVGVNEHAVELEDASIVYETGEWSSKDYMDAQKLPAKTWYVRLGSVESFGAGK